MKLIQIRMPAMTRMRVLSLIGIPPAVGTATR